jgi:hypothetical protein
MRNRPALFVVLPMTEYLLASAVVEALNSLLCDERCILRPAIVAAPGK